MSLERIHVIRHGFRTAWSVDHVSGIYTASLPSPTGIAADPALTSHGVNQAKELCQHLATLEPPVDVVYSSPYYRCLQTINPFVEARRQQHDLKYPETSKIRAEHGVCEWFGSAPFEHPQPAPLTTLKGMFPAIDESYQPAVLPSRKGETLMELQNRVASAMQAIIDRCDAEGRRSVVICTHAAVVIVLGRILTGQFPDDVETEDFQAFTCGLSEFRRRSLGTEKRQGPRGFHGQQLEDLYPVVGSWDCELNSDCSFLSTGEERGWRFSGDEAFAGTGTMSQESAESKL